MVMRRAAARCGEWAQHFSNASCLNIKKCCIISYGRSVDKTTTYALVDCNNQEAALERCDKIKDLGMWFDEKLSFREHIQDKINKTYMMLCIIKRNFRHLTLSTFILIYKTMVRSHLDYCCCVWAPYKKGDLEALEKGQQRFCHH